MSDEISRSAIAAELLKGRHYDRSNEYDSSRDLVGYAYYLKGLRHYLDTIRANSKALGSNLVLDIGAGKLNAASQLKNFEWMHDLRLEATTLTFDQEAAAKFGPGIHVTNVEALRGVEPNSVAAIIAVMSVAYSASPETAIESIDRVVVPSGFFKAVFRSEKSTGSVLMQPEPPDVFIKALKKAGWRVSVLEPERDKMKIVLAEKKPYLVDTEELIRADLDDFRNQMDVAIRNFWPKQ